MSTKFDILNDSPFNLYKIENYEWGTFCETAIFFDYMIDEKWKHAKENAHPVNIEIIIHLLQKRASLLRYLMHINHKLEFRNWNPRYGVMPGSITYDNVIFAWNHENIFSEPDEHGNFDVIQTWIFASTFPLSQLEQYKMTF